MRRAVNELVHTGVSKGIAEAMAARALTSGVQAHTHSARRAGSTQAHAGEDKKASVLPQSNYTQPMRSCSNAELSALAVSVGQCAASGSLASSVLTEVSERCASNDERSHFSIEQLCAVIAGMLRADTLQAGTFECKSLACALNSLATSLGSDNVLAVHEHTPSSAKRSSMLLHELSRVCNPPSKSLIRQTSRAALASLKDEPKSFTVADLVHLSRALAASAHVQTEVTSSLANAIDAELRQRLQQDSDAVPVVDAAAAVASLLRVGECSAEVAELVSARANPSAGSKLSGTNPISAAALASFSSPVPSQSTSGISGA